MSVRVTRFILLAFFTVGFWLTLTAFFSPTLYSPASLSHYLENGAWGDSVTIDAEQVEKIRELAQKFGGLYPMSYSRPARVMNQPALDRLLACAETQTCGPGEEKVVILASHHFGFAQTKQVSGEDIWAESTVEAFTRLNYTLLYTYDSMDTLLIYQHMPNLVKAILWESKAFGECRERNKTNYNDPEHDNNKGTWQMGRKGCIKKEGFEEGIPIWKSFVFHFWVDNRSPLGPQWTLSPINYAIAGNKVDANQYLGYTIEPRCRAVEPPEHREHRALALGKKGFFFDPEWRDFLWANLLPDVIKSIPPAEGESGEEPFQIVATASKEVDLATQGVINLGMQNQADWNKILVSSKVLLGVGNPYLSPSPYDGLCFGVPFINPIYYRDAENPDDWTKWQTQHNELRPIGPPYVYHVMGRNSTALGQAIRAALDNPIDRYIPEPMTRESVLHRHKQLVLTDWKQRAEERMQEADFEAKDFNYML